MIPPWAKKKITVVSENAGAEKNLLPGGHQLFS